MAAQKTDREILAEHDLDPDSWIVLNQVFNAWGSTTDPEQQYQQTKVHVGKRRPVEEIVVPARADGHKFKAPKAKSYAKKPKTVVFVGDQHAPFHDRSLHRLFLAWLDEHRPDEIILTGDGGDFPTISRHINKPEHTAKVQACVDGQYALYRDIREHAPQAVIKALVGNHEIRLCSVLLNYVTDLYGVAKAGDPDDLNREAVLSLSNLLRLDELAIELVEDSTKSGYETARIPITDDLIVRHGTKAVRGSGASAWKTLDNLDHSIVQGHSHRQALISRTLQTSNGPKSIWACETGAMCEVDLSKGYAADADWQQGWAVGTIWPDSSFSLELVRYEDKSLYYRGSRLK